MKLLGLVFALVAVAIAGCGGSTEAKEDEGAELTAALASSDVHETLCPVRGGTYSRGEWAKPDARMQRSASPVVLENLAPPQRFRTAPGKPWVTKAPIAVRLDGKPVEIAVADSGGAKVGLRYDYFAREYSPEGAFDRIRFLPCDGDPAEATWFGWPGGIVSDKENVCLKLAVREGNGDVSMLQVPLGNACPEGVDASATE